MEYEEERKMTRLNIGCAWKRIDGYVGVDIRKTRAADVVAPSWDLPYEDNEIEEVYTSHMMEHLKEDEIESTLKEFSRVLESNGKLVIRVPDFEVYAALFLERGWDWKSTWGLRYIFGYQRRNSDYHFTGWWKERFNRVLPQYGFKVVDMKNIDSRQPKGNAQFVAGGDILCTAVKV